ncbi:endoribonuclease MazF [Candidatus Saccharibacteria bacterium]|nr:endoribonuclease MazF [Candidatus Saccharibacteria bacterium]
MVADYVPARGDIVWFDFSPQIGHEQAGTRPALVISSRNYNERSGMMLACPITSKIKGYPFEVRVKSKKMEGAVLADQIKNVDWRARKPAYEERASDNVISKTQGLIESLVSG